MILEYWSKLNEAGKVNEISWSEFPVIQEPESNILGRLGIWTLLIVPDLFCGKGKYTYKEILESQKAKIQTLWWNQPGMNHSKDICTSVRISYIYLLNLSQGIVHFRGICWRWVYLSISTLKKRRLKLLFTWPHSVPPLQAKEESGLLRNL